MGTRNLTIVFDENEDLKVAQYGQWDGYIEGAGDTILKFLKLVDLPKFKERLKSLSFASLNFIKKCWVEAGADPKSDYVSMEVSAKLKQNHPELSRDTGSEILSLLMFNDKIKKLKDDIDFAQDSLFCEYAYVIDLKKNVLEVYTGFNKKPLSPEDRFYKKNAKPDNQGYYAIRLAKSYPLDKLPTTKQMGKDCDKKEE